MKYKGCLYDVKNKVILVEMKAQMPLLRTALISCSQELSEQCYIFVERSVKFNILKCTGLLKFYLKRLSLNTTENYRE